MIKEFMKYTLLVTLAALCGVLLMGMNGDGYDTIRQPTEQLTRQAPVRSPDEPPEPDPIPQNPSPPSKPTTCPDRYVYVHQRTYGRHHNQIVSLVNIIAIATLLDRTVVIPSFRQDHKWWPAETFYDFTEMAKYYCIISETEGTRRVSQKDQSTKTLCYDTLKDGLSDVPMKRGWQCTEKSWRYLDRNPKPLDKPHNLDARVMLEDMIQQSRDYRWLGIGARTAYYLRIPNTVQPVYSLLKPSKAVRDEMDAFKRRVGIRGNQYAAAHVRNREGQSSKEVEWSLERLILSSDEIENLRDQTNLRLEVVQGYLQKKPVWTNMKLFVASDGQTSLATFEKAGALFYSGQYPSRSMMGLAIDFFMLVDAEVFFGNQMSSVSVNACFARGSKNCANFHPRMHAMWEATVLGAVVTPVTPYYFDIVKKIPQSIPADWLPPPAERK